MWRKRVKKSRRYPEAFCMLQSPCSFQPFPIHISSCSVVRQLLSIFALYLTYCLVFIVERRNDKLKAWTEEFIRSFHHWAEALRFGMWFTCVFHVIFALCRPALFRRELMVAVFLIISLFQVPVICMCGALRIFFLCCMCPPNIYLKVMSIRSNRIDLRQLNFFLVWKILCYTIIEK